MNKVGAKVTIICEIRYDPYYVSINDNSIDEYKPYDFVFQIETMKATSAGNEYRIFYEGASHV